MTNEQILTELYKIGKLPSGEDSDSNNFPLGRFDELLQQFNTPVTESEAVKLINLSPPIDTSCYKVEWFLLRLIETVDVKVLQNILNNSEENELKRIIQIRLDNYNKDAVS